MTNRSLPRLLAAAALLVAVAAPAASAQGYFGQNQVQYDKFDWQVIETEHFLVHYYPAERIAAVDAARMAERAYARLSKILDHQFREKKPIILYASRTDFGQNNVFGDLGEGTGGVTEALRHRILMPFTGDYASFEQVLAHEMVHEFQYDVFSRGHAGGGLQTLAQVNPPLWFMEGMAEYLSTGPVHRLTDTWVRDALLNGNFPTIKQMTERPDRFFPYRYGESLWEYIGSHWGDEIVGQILAASATVGIERAFKRELGVSLEDLSDEWREAMQQQHLPAVAQLQRPRRFSQPLLTERKSGGQIFLAPALSPDGSQVAFLSNGSFLRGEVFIDLWLADAKTGKRIKRLVKSTTNPDFEELRVLYSQSSFSPDGRHLAFTAQREGKDVLYVIDTKRRRGPRLLDLPLEGVTGPTWSPDGKRLAFSGNVGGITDLYVVDVDGKNFRRLTNDRHGDLQPQWSPDGKSIAFASDRGEKTDFDLLRFSDWRVALHDMETGQTSVLPGQDGLNLNPQWAPDGKSLIFVSDRTGVQNLFLYDFATREHYQLTDVVGGVLAFAEYSPVISWARGADRLAFTYYENGDYTVWGIDNPRMLKRQPYRAPVKTENPALIAERVRADSLQRALAAAADTSQRVWQRSFYRTAEAIRPSEILPAAAGTDTTILTVAALLDSAAFALPDTSAFKQYEYHVGFQPEYVARPSIGYAQDNFGRGVFGGTTIILSDLLGNHQLAFSGEVNGRVSEARVFGAYTNLSRRLQYMTGLYQEPLYFLSDERIEQVEDNQGNVFLEQDQDLTRYIVRQAFAIAMYPLNRFTRFEAGARFNNIDRTTITFSRLLDERGYPLTGFGLNDQRNEPGLNYVSLHSAYVSDNTLFGYTGPIFGRRYRFAIEPTVGSYHWVEYNADYRRYDAILFNFLTVATRLQTSLSVGRDEDRFPKYIGRPEFIRGYDRENYFSGACTTGIVTNVSDCSAVRLLGSRVALANAELRFPLVRRFELGILPIGLPPLDGLVFYDAGIAWSRGQDVTLRRPTDEDETLDTRYPLTSYGVGLRLNLFNYAILRWDYAIPLDKPGRKGFWTWSLGPSF